jgi:hypothetical protein
MTCCGVRDDGTSALSGGAGPAGGEVLSTFQTAGAGAPSDQLTSVRSASVRSRR